MSLDLSFNDQSVQKNLSAMSAIVGQNNAIDLRKRLDSCKVRVILQDSVKNNENFRIACFTSLNLLPRLLRNVSYSGTLDILKHFPQSHVSKISLGNGDCDSSTTLVFGKESMSVKNPLYVGSEGWSCYLSRENPCPWTAKEYNALSSMFAASLSVGENLQRLDS